TTRLAPCDTDILPLMLAKLMVQDAPLGTVMLPLTVVTVAALPKVPVQFVSARTADVPPRSAAAARATASVKVLRVLVRPSSARPAVILTALETRLMYQKQHAFLVRIRYSFRKISKQHRGYPVEVPVL